MCTVERGLSSESGSVSGPPTPSGFGWRRVPLERIPSGGFTRKSEGHDANEPDNKQHEDAPHTACRAAEQPLTGGGIDEVRVADVGRAVHDDVFETDGAFVERNPASVLHRHLAGTNADRAGVETRA